MEEIGLNDGDSPSSILQAAKSRFLQFADDFTFLNPHLTLTVDWHGDRHEVSASNPGWSKWRPSDPTCAHWYGEEHFQRLLAAYISHDEAFGGGRTVREFVAEFRGLSSSVKQKTVLDATGLARTNLAELGAETIRGLLTAMKAHSKPVKPNALGIIGTERLRARFSQIGCEMDSFTYQKKAGETDNIPWVMEAAFGWCPEATGRRIVTGVNWSPGIINPFRELGRFGQSLDSVLAEQRAGEDEPIVLVLHMACPRVEFADRGKSSVIIG